MRAAIAIPFVAALMLTDAWVSAAPAQAQAALPSQLLGAWGSDSSCTADVVVFRADGAVVAPGAVQGTPATTYSVNGGTLTLTQGKQQGHFAFAVADQAVAWSDGATVVLKERCADQDAFVKDLGTAAPPASLYDRLRALAAEPLRFNGIAIKVVGVEGHTALSPSAGGTLYSEIIAHPDPAIVGTDAMLLYRIFPTAAAAAAHVSLAAGMRTSFIYEHRGAGFFSTASAVDEGSTAGQGKPVTIDCLRFHPKGRDAVVISCFAQMPQSRLVAGAQQRFPLPRASRPNDMGSKEDLSEVLDLTSLAIDRLHGLLAPAAP